MVSKLFPDIGVNFHGMWSAYPSDDNDRRTVLAAMRDAGMTSVRLDVSWEMVQPTAHGSYDMSYGVPFVDRVIRLCNSYGIKPLILFWLTPGWARAGGTDNHYLPTTASNYSDALVWMAQRYRGLVTGWEVWNEPNDGAFMHGASASAYTAQLVSAYNAVKAAGITEPVVFGGTSYVDTPWITSCYTAGVAGKFDVMNVHPYMSPSDLDPVTPDVPDIWHLTHVTTVHDLMVTNGDGHKPIWFTEFGWSSHPNGGTEPSYAIGVSETLQGTYMTRTIHLIQNSYPYVERVYWYDDRDGPETSIQNSNYGLLNAGLEPKRVLRNIKALFDRGY